VDDATTYLLANLCNYLNSQGKQRAPQTIGRVGCQRKVDLEDTQRLGSALEKSGSRTRARGAGTRSSATRLRLPIPKRARLTHVFHLPFGFGPRTLRGGRALTSMHRAIMTR
jgi:hypothetical protein